MRLRFSPAPWRGHAPRFALVLFLAIAGCGGDDDGPTNPPAGTVEDTIRIVVGAFNKMGMAFTPNPDTVSVGTTVRWINQDSTPHTITSDPGTSESFNLMVGAGAQVIRPFINAGSFPYHCSLTGHDMTATLVVIP